jgi:hypothetical protein
VTPRGGDLLTRSLENFQPPPRRSNVSDDRTGSVSGDEATNKDNEEKMDVCDPNESGTGGVRTMRGVMVMENLIIHALSLIIFPFHRSSQGARAESSLPARRIIHTTGTTFVRLFTVAISKRK